MRSAKAPSMSAGVISANMHWNIANTSSGMPLAMVADVSTPAMNALSKPPITAHSGLPLSLKPVPKAHE